MLALGGDDKLKVLAVTELMGVAGAKEQASLGDGWWDLAGIYYTRTVNSLLP